MPALAALAGCGVTDTGPHAAGTSAHGLGTAAGQDVLRVYFLTPQGSWPVARTVPDRGEPQSALDALLAGPTSTERSRGLFSALPAHTHRVRARASTDDVELYLPWLVSELSRAAVNQLVCTAAAADAPEGRTPQEVVVRIHESGISGGAWPTRCDGNGVAAPVDTAAPADTAAPGR
ncbi:hypothetical protein HY68_35685 [Streptomyces sp. AcH 505]|nr:hypothetical protein HY68_35685 [Streptomyces sp. AcH 505]